MDRPSTVEMRVEAAPEYLIVLRNVAADLAMGRDFDLDSISDFRIAVDEACAILLRLAEPKAVLRCLFHVRTDEIRVHVEVPCSERPVIAQDTFTWHVLTTLADSVTTNVTEAAGHSAGFLASIELTKKPVSAATE
ncbi:ATP-binding protein [Goodfellowiella coeruleoviolacea]|uniref:Serine/threonine-protein kinase RsbW n=1 Tax=Goodfellowiella coeruleoviolacea TaxID=334858 RepID=A0AAE3GE28_9PSEU|nr:hypothetical protein [Goodfellowiella coeruleoviolacea]MCP2166516.1 serine/threonine-protein kinase RsbW [Goodfellowiella coeruleoviolacea]